MLYMNKNERVYRIQYSNSTVINLKCLEAKTAKRKQRNAFDIVTKIRQGRYRDWLIANVVGENKKLLLVANLQCFCGGAVRRFRRKALGPRNGRLTRYTTLLNDAELSNGKDKI